MRKFRRFTLELCVTFVINLLVTIIIEDLDIVTIWSPEKISTLLFNFRFYVYWFGLILFLTLIHIVSRRFINSKQAFPEFYMPGGYAAVTTLMYKDLKWKLHFDYIGRALTKEQFNSVSSLDDLKRFGIKDITVGYVEGPYCHRDMRELKVERTYLGRYKYRCPKCNFKKVSIYNDGTLEKDVKDEVESRFR